MAKTTKSKSPEAAETSDVLKHIDINEALQEIQKAPTPGAVEIYLSKHVGAVSVEVAHLIFHMYH